MVVRVTMNLEDKGDLFVGRTPDLDYLVKLEDLKAIGLKEAAGAVVLLEGEPYVSLRSLPGIRFAFEEKGLRLNIMADPDLLPSQALNLRSDNRIRGVIPQNSSVFFNYALTAARNDVLPGTGTGSSFSGEAGWRIGDYLVMSNGNTVRDANGQSKFVRLMTNATYDDRDNLRRTVAGDFFTPSRQFSNGINLGGISVSKLYGLNPYLTSFPMQSISGSVATPTDLDVYLDGQRIRSEKLRPGEFELKDLLAYGGARNVQVVLRDAFGRVQEINYSFYFTDQPLRQGLHEYSYNLGALRRNFGLASNQYGPAAFSVFHRYGFSDALTLGLRAEGTKGFSNTGPLATVVLGSAGVLNLALAASSLDTLKGGAGSVSYNYQAQRWSLGMSLRRDWGDYASLGDPPTLSNRKYEGNISASYYLKRYGSISVGHSVFSARTEQPAPALTPLQPLSILGAGGSRRASTLSYGVSLISGRLSLQSSLSHVTEGTSRNEVFVGLIFYPDKDYSVASNYFGDKESHTTSDELVKTQPVGEGLGYVLSANRATGNLEAATQLAASVQYNAPLAIVRGEFGRRPFSGQSHDDYRVSVAGGVAYVDGELALGRPVTESFGIVKVGELPGVGVAVNGQPIGKTNARGKLFVPTLTPYFDNDVSIDPETVPIEYAIPATVKKISPSLRSGAVINFGVTKIQAFTGKLEMQQAGNTKPVEFQEFSITVKGKRLTLLTGRGGEFYSENLLPGTYSTTVLADGKPCDFDLVIPQSDETFVELGKLVCRLRP